MKILRLAVLAAALPLAVIATAQTVGPGSPAPALSVKNWFKGTPVKELAKNKTYVVEFWATWCGPCIQSIPHVTKLAKANKDVTFLGISIWEDNQGTKIADFVKKMGDQMDYHVGWSGNQEGMSQTWMRAAGQNGIPAAFIVKNGVVQWVGHPMAMDKPLAEIKAGTFDLKAEKARFDKEMADQKAAEEAGRMIVEAQGLYEKGDKDAAKAKLNDAEKKAPSSKPDIELVRMKWLSVEDPAAFDTKLNEIASDLTQANKQMLSMLIAENGMSPKGDRQLAKKVLGVALKATQEKDLVFLYYGALVSNQLKEYKEAVGMLDKALALFPTSEYKDNAQLKTTLENMRKDMASKANI